MAELNCGIEVESYSQPSPMLEQALIIKGIQHKTPMEADLTTKTCNCCSRPPFFNSGLAEICLSDSYGVILYCVNLLARASNERENNYIFIK